MRSSNAQLSYLQILEEILDACTEPKERIQIVGKTGVTMKKLQFCLKHLVKQNLVKFHHRKRTYVTTEKGLRFLLMHRKLE